MVTILIPYGLLELLWSRQVHAGGAATRGRPRTRAWLGGRVQGLVLRSGNIATEFRVQGLGFQDVTALGGCAGFCCANSEGSVKLKRLRV